MSTRGGPPLRLVARSGRVVSSRACVLALGSLARVSGMRAYTLWPSPEEPRLVVPAGDPRAAGWLQRAFEPGARRSARIDPAAWSVLRARGVVVAARGEPAVAAAERALGRRLARPSCAAFSASGGALSKVTVFVFEARAADPSLVVRGMGDRAGAHRLRRETELVESVRGRLANAPEVAAALPLAPLAIDTSGGDYLVVQEVDPLASAGGPGGDGAAREWLRAFHAQTTDAGEPWGDADDEAALAAVEAAWTPARPDSAEAVLDSCRACLAAVHGLAAPRCASHGDFYRGNVAVAGGRLRVFDWEWAELRARPFLDIWTWELAELFDRPRADRLADALTRVESELSLRGIAPGFARATLAPALAELVVRLRRLTGCPGGLERRAPPVMDLVERVLVSARGR